MKRSPAQLLSAAERALHAWAYRNPDLAERLLALADQRNRVLTLASTRKRGKPRAK